LSWEKRLPARAWQRVSAGPGAKGPRWYDWALTEVTDPAAAEGDGPNWLLIRRRISDGEYAFYRAHASRPVPLALLVRVAGSRWKIEDGFAAGKELAALDEHQVRSWTSWHRWTILALLAHAFLAVLAAARRQPATGQPADPADLPRDPQAVHRTVPVAVRTRHPAALVTMATPTSGHRPSLPLPPTSPRTRMITKCCWSIS
jgi:SRSO17 transposase